MTEYPSLKSTRVKALHFGSFWMNVPTSEFRIWINLSPQPCLLYSFGRFIRTSNPQGDGPTSRLDGAQSGSSQKNDTGPSATVTTDLFVLVLKWPEAPGHFGHPRAGSPLRRQRPFFVASSDWARKNCCSSSFSPPLPGRWESYYCSKTIRKQIFENNFKKSYQKYENVFYQDRSYSKTQPRNNEDAWCLTALAHLTSWSTIYHTKISGGDLGREFYQKTGNLELEDIPTAMLLDPWWWYCRCLSWRL